MEIKIQTKRSTDYKDDIINFNAFVIKGFEIGIITSKDWGRFEDRDEPLIDITINKGNYLIPLSLFLETIKPLFNKLDILKKIE